VPVTVSVQNFGPIREAEIELKPLMVLVGINNTGKTYFATALQRVLEAATSGLDRWERHTFEQLFDRFRGKTFHHGDAFAAPAIGEWVGTYIHDALTDFCVSVHDGIEYAFGVPGSELRRRTSSGRRSRGRARISIRQISPTWSADIDVATGEADISPPDQHELLSRHEEQTSPTKVSTKFGGTGDLLQIMELFRYLMDLGSVRGLFGDWPASSVHLPASRTGIMQSYQVIASRVVQQSVEAGIRRLDVPTLPGTTADFLSLLLALTQRRTAAELHDRAEVVDLVESFEREIGLQIDVDADHATPGITAMTAEGRFPLSQTSSMVSELAPVLLTAKNVLAPNDCLVVDEPEAHLHPALQKSTARFFAALANRGVRTVLTTHSDFLLGELNNLIRSHAVRPARRKSRGEALGEPIDPANVAALRFDRTGTGCVATPLPVDPIDGIDESTFGDVMEALYDESIALTDSMNESA
jgi:hypothetical protein